MISFEMPGRVKNTDVLKYYAENEVDCFVHTSESEGGPAVIMEAEGAGIPIVATDVGVTSEAIEDNGVLLPVDCAAEEIADAFLKVLLAPQKTKESMRQTSRKIWEEKFDAGKNAQRFADYIDRESGSKRHILFLTEGFPYRPGEASFFRTELKELVKRYDVTIIPRVTESITEKQEEVAKNVMRECIGEDWQNRARVITYREKWNAVDSLYFMLRYFADSRTALERSCIKESAINKRIRFWESIKFYGKSLKFYKWFKESVLTDYKFLNQTLIYSYWNLQPTLGICLNRGSLDGLKVITRVHGYDWQDDQWPDSLRKPFAETADGLLDAVIFDSRKGLNIYLDRYKPFIRDKDKYSYRYFGTLDPEDYIEKGKEDGNKVDLYSSASGTGVYRIASCAAMIPLKRIHLIIDALRIIKDKRPDIDIKWVHFGTGPLKEELERYAENQLHSTCV